MQHRRCADAPTRSSGTAVPAVLAGVIALAVVVLLPGEAGAHSVLLETVPADDEQLEVPPGQVALTFNEPVTAPPGGVRVYDSSANRVDDGPVDPPAPEQIVVALPDDLPDGAYVVTWRVVSADSHPIAGVFTFRVGGSDQVDDAVIEELFGGIGAGSTGIAGSLLRWLAYTGTLVASGSALTAAFVLRRPRDRELARGVLLRSALVAATATVFALPVQASAVTGFGATALVRDGVAVDVLASSFGQSTIVRLIWVGVLALLAARRAPVVGQVAAAVLTAASFAIDGHQRSFEPAWLVIGADVVHLLAASAWFGGLVVLALVARDLRDGGPDREAVVRITRFSNLALVAAAVVAASGAAMSLVLVGSARALTSTGYGLTLAGKLALVVLVLLVAAHNRLRLVPAMTGGRDASPSAAEAHVRLRRSMRVEAGLIVLVLAVTGALVTQQPAARAVGATGVFVASAELDETRTVELIVEPNRVGRNAIHLYVFDATGRPSAEVEDVTLRLTYRPEQIGPIEVEPFFAGTGHWVANVDDLVFAGPWSIEVVAGVDRFTELRAGFDVEVRP